MHFAIHNCHASVGLSGTAVGLKRILEDSIEGDVKKFVEEQGYDVYPQVQVLGRRIDLLGIREGRMLAVELKVRDWKYAIYQAYLASLCANRVYVALPNATIHLVKRDAFVENGVGLLSVNGGVEVVVEARELNNVHPILQRKIAESLRDSSEIVAAEEEAKKAQTPSLLKGQKQI